MRVTVTGVMRMKGTGKESGMPYDFAQAFILTPMQTRTSEKMSIVGLGFEVGKLDMKIEALAKFNEVKFPAELDLEIEHVADRRGMKPVVVGFRAVQSNPLKVA